MNTGEHSPLAPLQAALYARLAETIDPSVGIWDYVPENAPYPFVQIGEDSATDASTKTLHGEEVVETLHIYSQYRGRLEIKRIIDALQYSVSSTKLSFAGWGFSYTGVKRKAILDMPDGITTHAVLGLGFRATQL